MLEHLMDEVIYEPEVLTPEDLASAKEIKRTTPQNLLDAQVETTKWLEELGATPDAEIFMQVEEAVSRETFAALSANTDPNAQRNQLIKIKTPEAVRHLVGMLTAYDWHFVEQAKELRGYAVAQLVEETKHPDAKIRLRALELLGKVTEVALFTERVEV